MCMPLKPQSLHVDLHEHHEVAYHSPALALIAWLMALLALNPSKLLNIPGRKV